MPSPSESGFSDTTTPSTLQRMGADFSDDEKARHLYFPRPSQSRQSTAAGTLEEMVRKNRAGEELNQTPLDAPEPDAEGPPTVLSKLVNVALDGMVPVMMRENGECDVELGGSGMAKAEMERDCPLSLSRTVTTTTDPVAKVSWGPENHIITSGETMKVVQRLKEREKENIKEELKMNRAREKSIIAEEMKAQPIKKSLKDQLIDEIVGLMSEDKVLGLRDIQMRVNRPESDILEVLNKVAFLWNEGDFVGKWELKPKFKKPVTEKRACHGPQVALVDASEHEHDTESDTQPGMDQKQLPMPPPGTPHPELDAASRYFDLDLLKHSLSTPTLPTFHSISDAALVATYRAERAKDPATFDKKTASIRESLTTAKIHRGGSNFLTQGDYTVELASREDAAKVERWKHGEKSPEEINEGEVSNGGVRQVETDKVRKRRHTKRRLRGSRAEREITPTLPSNFDLAENVSKYAISGSLRQQCTRQVEEDESGTMTAYTTWIEIKQQVFVPSNEDVDWEDVVEALKKTKARKKREAQKELAEKADGDAGNERDPHKKKHISKKIFKDDSAETNSSSSSSKDDDGWCRNRQSQRVKNETEKAVEANWKKDFECGHNRNPIDAARMVGELVTAIDDLRVGKAAPKADLLEAISKQMLEVAKFVDQSVESGADRPTRLPLPWKDSCSDR